MKAIHCEICCCLSLYNYKIFFKPHVIFFSLDNILWHLWMKKNIYILQHFCCISLTRLLTRHSHAQQELQQQKPKPENRNCSLLPCTWTKNNIWDERCIRGHKKWHKIKLNGFVKLRFRIYGGSIGPDNWCLSAKRCGGSWNISRYEAK